MTSVQFIKMRVTKKKSSSSNAELDFTQSYYHYVSKEIYVALSLLNIYSIAAPLSNY